MSYGEMGRRYPLATFFVLSCAFAWPFAFAIALFGAPLETSFIAALGPMAAAIVAHRWSGEGGPPFRWHSGWVRTAIGTLASGGLTLAAFIALPAILMSEDVRKLNSGILIAASSYNWSTLLGGPLGEEPAWHGYALPRMQARFGVLRGSLLLGIIWTSWHLPLFVSDAWPHPPFSLYLPLLMSMTIIQSFGANLARFAVIPAIVGHALFNSMGTLIAGLFATEPMSTRNFFWEGFGFLMQQLGMPPFAMNPSQLVVACGLTVAMAVIVCTRGRLGGSRAASTIGSSTP